MSRTPIYTLVPSFVGQQITVWGWVKFSRRQGKLVFLKIYDSWAHEVQVVIDFRSGKFSDEEMTALKQIQIGWSVSVTGLFKDSPAPGQPFEISADKVEIIGKVDDQATYPLAKTDHTMEHFRHYPQLECRSLEKSTIYGLRDIMMQATHAFFHSKGFGERFMPLITFSECEGGCQPMQCTLLLTDKKHSSIPQVKSTEGEVKDEVDFSKDFFGSCAFLTVSGQLELETQLPLGPGYTLTKAVRGEPSTTSKHLCEFTMLEIEHLSESSKDVVDVTEEYIKYVLCTLLSQFRSHLEYLESKFEKGLVEKLELCVTKPFLRKTHAECITILQEQKDVKFETEPVYDGDLASEHERYLVDVYFKSPVVVTRYPKKIKSFYMPLVEETSEESHGVEHVDCFDILVPGLGELVGGSQRIHKLDELEARIQEQGLDPVALDFYIDMRRKGTMPHGGMGLGIERLVKYVTGAPSVKDCVPFPRYYGSGK